MPLVVGSLAEEIMLKKIALGLLAAIAAFAVLVALQPTKYHVERTVELDAPPEIVFAHVSDLEGFQRWSHWADADPNMKKTFGEITAGLGATYEWSGNTPGGAGWVDGNSAPSGDVGGGVVLERVLFGI